MLLTDKLLRIGWAPDWVITMERVCFRLGNYNREGVLQTRELQWRWYAPDWAITMERVCSRVGNYNGEGMLQARVLQWRGYAPD